MMRMIITGGGTGGHVYPGIAVAREIESRGKNEILFVGAKRGIESRLVPENGYKIELIEITGLKGRGLLAKLSTLAKLVTAVFRAFAIIKKFRPDLVLGVGGYASGPVGIAAKLAGIPVALAEQNALPGMTNRWLGRFVAQKVFVTWPESVKSFSADKAVVTGNPIRPEFFEVKRMRTDNLFSLLVIGGSQGAVSINNAICDSIGLFNANKDKLRIVHQSGRNDERKVKEAYTSAEFEHEVKAFLDDMPQRLADADLVISRAGAGAISEICAVGRGAVYVPFPGASDDHQTKNGVEMEKAGAGIVVDDKDFNAEKAVALIKDFLADTEKAEEMGRQAKAKSVPGSAEKIADHLFEMVREAA